MFEKKSVNVKNMIAAIDGKIKDLDSKIAAKMLEIDSKKMDCTSALGRAALEENDANLAEVKRAKASLERMQESLDDMKIQMTFLKAERKKLDKDLCEAIIRDNEKSAEETAAEFNKILEDGIAAVEKLKSIYSQLKEKEILFYALLNERTAALEKLGRLEPLELKEGLGKMAFLGSPYGFSVQLPADFDGIFLNAIIAYGQKLKNYQDYKSKNPEEKPAPEQEKRGFTKFIQGFRS